MNIYPYSTPLILTEGIYTQYGGQTGTMTTAQLESAYLVAETRMTSYIGTFLLPTIVTGTFHYKGNQFITTDYGYVHQILSAELQSLDGSSTCTLKSESGCAIIRNDTFGYLDYQQARSVCGCTYWQTPYQFQVAYQAGLPTGTANHPNILHALTIVAELAINEIMYPRGNETQGDRGLTEWEDIGYKEKRKPLKTTALGQSARANYAAELVDSVIKKARPALLMR